MNHIIVMSITSNLFPKLDPLERKKSVSIYLKSIHLPFLHPLNLILSIVYITIIKREKEKRTIQPASMRKASLTCPASQHQKYLQNYH